MALIRARGQCVRRFGTDLQASSLGVNSHYTSILARDARMTSLKGKFRVRGLGENA